MVRAGFAFILAVLSVAIAGASDSKAGVVGVWRFQDEVDRRADGSTVVTGPSLGYDGVLIFTPNGYMSSTLLPKGRRWTIDTVSAAELKESIGASSAHVGRYKLDPKSGAINIEAIVSLDPGEEGKWSPVSYSVIGDTLTISGPWKYHGEKLTFTVRLARVK
jgi:hypothetical protein